MGKRNSLFPALKVCVGGVVEGAKQKKVSTLSIFFKNEWGRQGDKKKTKISNQK